MELMHNNTTQSTLVNKCVTHSTLLQVTVMASFAALSLDRRPGRARLTALLGVACTAFSLTMLLSWSGFWRLHHHPWAPVVEEHQPDAASPGSVIVSGVSGLGNNLFQIAAAVFYAETYGFNIVLDVASPSLRWGTAGFTNRDKARRNLSGNRLSYLDTIFKSPRLRRQWVGRDSNNGTGSHWLATPVTTVHNDYTAVRFVPHDVPASTSDATKCTTLHLTGFHQHRDLFLPTLPHLPTYLNLDAGFWTRALLRTRYRLSPGHQRHAIMLGVRRGADFAHMTKVGMAAYERGLRSVFETRTGHATPWTLVVLADTDVSDMRLAERASAIAVQYGPHTVRTVIIAEDDITQLHAGLACDHFILSESTFHYWIAVLRGLVPPRRPGVQVVVFEGTDLTDRTLALDGWTRLPY